MSDHPIASDRRPLRAGSRVGEIEFVDVIAEGSIAIVYAGTDRALAVPVAIAEYMPARLARRDDEARVIPRSSSEAVAFANGLKAFVEEARMLARCDHPSLVRVTHLLEGNATAYRVMPRYPSRRLLEARQAMNEPPGEDALRALLDALLGALEAFHHAAGQGHGNVTPANILLLADNRPVLLGPGAAARAIASDPIDALTTSVEPCFAPIEQIVEADRPLQPPVDLYALAGVARYWLSGQLPPAFSAGGAARPETLANTVRQLGLTWPRLQYSASLVEALDSALSIYPAQRPRSVAELRERLGKAPAAPAVRIDVASIVDAARDDSDRSPAPGVDRVDVDPAERPASVSRGRSPRRIATAVVLVLLAVLAIGAYGSREEDYVGRALEVLGIRQGTRAADSASVSTSPATPVTPSTPEPAAVAESRTSAPASGGEASGKTPSLDDAPPPAPAPEPRVASPPPAQPAPRNASPAPASPRAACGARTEFALYRCMQRECSQRQWLSHPQCERLRTRDTVD